MIPAFLFFFGLFWGSFLFVLATRLPKGEDVITSRSHCDFCKHTLTWYELIPLLSYLCQHGKTRCCHKKLSWQYPLVELVTGIGFVGVYCYQFAIPGIGASLIPGMAVFSLQTFFSFSYLLSLISYLFLFSCLLVIFIADLTYEIIPIEMIIVGFFAGLCFHVMNFINFTNFINFFLSALGAGGFFFLLWYVSKGKAMGDGDIYLALLIGFLLGFPQIIISLYAAFLTGAVIGVILVLRRKKSFHSHIPFGPFLIFGYAITLFWGNHILQIWRLLW